MREISRTFEIKVNQGWMETYRTTDRTKVYEDLATELLNAKIFKYQSYTRMKQHNNYDGTRTIIFYQTNGRSVYTVKA